MTLSNFNRRLKYSSISMAAVFSSMLLGSCNSVIYDGTDCVESSNLIKLTYDHNIKFADAFDHEVEQVSLLAFSRQTGKLVQRIDIDSDKLTANNEIPVNFTPGQYELLVWAGRHGESFDIERGSVDVSQMPDFHCRMHRQEGGHINEDLARLYHGTLSLDCPYASPSNPHRSEIKLKKNTNTIRVILQHVDGDRVDCDDFDFTITDRNGWMNHDNSLRTDETLTYHPWYLFSGSVDVNTDPTDAPGSRSEGLPALSSRSNLGAALAEFTTGRLIWGAEPILTITDKKTGKTVIRVNVNDYAMLVKGFYNRKMTEQEYLDRQDEYNMTFFLSSGNKWLNTEVIINDWRIVRHVTSVE